jgi:hypothetical protein
MLKELFSKFWKFVATKEFIVLVIFLILLWALLNYSNNKSLIKDGYTGSSMDSSANKPNGMNIPPNAHAAMENTQVAGAVKPGYDFRSTTNPSDLLPQDKNSEWSALNPVNQGNAAMPDLLQAGYHIGLDTIGQTLRNPNYQLRSDPIIPKSEVGPWNKSTIEPDLGRVPLEVGSGVR